MEYSGQPTQGSSLYSGQSHPMTTFHHFQQQPQHTAAYQHTQLAPYPGYQQ